MPDIEKLKSQITGCWLGKNIGGTLGAPFEGTKEILDLTFYTQKSGQMRKDSPIFIKNSKFRGRQGI